MGVGASRPLSCKHSTHTLTLNEPREGMVTARLQP